MWTYRNMHLFRYDGRSDVHADATCYSTPLPYPDGHKLFQDNDPKHTSRVAKAFMQEKNVNWLPSPPESLDLNQIEICCMN